MISGQLKVELKEPFEMVVEDDLEEMARKELGCERRLHGCCSYSETGIIPLLKSVARIRLVKTEGAGVFVTANCKVRR
jgi:hypothetical protein